MKTIAFAHPDKTMFLDVPDHIFDELTLLMGAKVIKPRWKNTNNNLRGNNAELFVVTEYLTNSPKGEQVNERN